MIFKKVITNYMKKKFIIAGLIGTALVYLTSCYNNQKDIATLPTVSFVNQIAPIVTASACGCHNNGNGTSVVQFSNLYKANHGADTINYDVIYGKKAILAKWADSSGSHPGMGGVYLTVEQEATISQWIALGAPDDVSAGPVTGTITYAVNIAPIVSSVCSGSSCHGGLAFTMNQAALVAHESALTGFVNDGQWTGHGGGKQSASVTATLKAWIAQGMK
jgi:hypothetical protein